MKDIVITKDGATLQIDAHRKYYLNDIPITKKAAYVFAHNAYEVKDQVEFDVLRMDTNAMNNAKNSRTISMRLNNKNDADLIGAIESASSMQGEIKRLMRLGLEHERQQNGGDE